MQRVILATLLVLSLTNCGSDDDGFDIDYNGIWDVRYNFSADECQIVEAGVLGFVDQHVIAQTGNVIALDSTVGLGFPLNGALREDSSFLAEQQISGDLFGDGTLCSQAQSISYQQTDSDRADSQFVRRISCNDGYVCESRAVGEARRQ